MDRSEGRSPLQIFELEDLKKLIEQNYDLLIDLEKSKFRVRSVNHSYLIVTNLGKFVLRLSKIQTYMNHDLADYKFEAEALTYLHSHRIPVIHPFRRKDGEFVSQTDLYGKKYYYILFSFAPGKPNTSLSESQYSQIGKIVARMHLQWDVWKPTYTRFSYTKEKIFERPIQIIKQYLGEEYPEYLTAIIQFRDYAKKKLTGLFDSDNYHHYYGIIHGDLHTFNMHFDGDNVTIFDFDEMGYGLRIFDIAGFVYTKKIRESKEQLGFDAQQSFLDGYNSIRKLSQEEIDLIPTLKIIQAIIVYGLWAHLIGTKSFEKEHEKMSKYIIGLFKESIPQIANIIANELDDRL